MGRTGSSCGVSRAEAAVVALGNPYRGDDGVGPALLRLLKVTGERKEARHASPVTRHEIDLIEGVHDGLRLAEAFLGYERVLVVDAAPWLPPGEVVRFRLEELPASAGYFHGIGFRAALELLARARGEGVPEVEVLAIGVPEDPRFGEGLSPAVERALPGALEEAIRWLNE
jgi:hydrogenase maturation protease